MRTLFLENKVIQLSYFFNFLSFHICNGFIGVKVFCTTNAAFLFNEHSTVYTVMLTDDTAMDVSTTDSLQCNCFKILSSILPTPSLRCLTCPLWVLVSQPTFTIALEPFTNVANYPLHYITGFCQRTHCRWNIIFHFTEMDNKQLPIYLAILQKKFRHLNKHHSILKSTTSNSITSNAINTNTHTFCTQKQFRVNQPPTCNNKNACTLLVYMSPKYLRTFCSSFIYSDKILWQMFPANILRGDEIP